MTIRLVLLSLVVAASACQGGANNPFGSIDGGVGDLSFVIGNNPDLETADAITFANADLASDVNGPTITVTAPAVNMEVPGDTLVVTATITGHNGAFIDGTSVLLEIPSNAAGGFDSVPMTLTAAANVYEGSIDIGGIPSGMSEFTVTAADVMGRRANVRQVYVHDHGPVITFIQPQRATATGSLYVEIVVDDSLHPLADASTVKATIHNGDNIVLTQIAGAVPLRVQGTISFASYSPPLDGTQLLTVSATNSKGTKGQAVKQFTVDNLGPVISFINPAPGQFIGGVLQIEASIDDLSGVDDSSVVAVFGGNTTFEVQLMRELPGMPKFSGLFDVRQLGTNYVLPTLSIRADDQLGNHSELAEEIVVDNVPPAISLDPPKMFIGLVQAEDFIECTQPFDPLGDDAANDLDVVQQIVTLRARIEDEGNDAPGLAKVRVSLVNPDSVFLLGIPASSGALAVDTDNDTVCDDVNPVLQPTANISNSLEAISVQMAVIPPAGSGDLRPNPTPSAIPVRCSQVGESGGVDPEPLCIDATRNPLPIMSIAIGYTDGNEPAIWTIPPVTSTPSGCVGFQFDTLNSMPEGPACFVVVARDNAGNHSVSKPLRLCINRSTLGATGPCAGWPGTALDCLGTYDKATKMTGAPACSPAPGNFVYAVPELRIQD